MIKGSLSLEECEQVIASADTCSEWTLRAEDGNGETEYTIKLNTRIKGIA